MKKVILPIVLLFLVATFSLKAQEKTYQVKSFDKIIVSPHIEVNLVEGDEESVKIENAKVGEDKINVEVDGKTLRIYLEGAKMVTKSEKVEQGKGKWKKSIYAGTMMTATITYKTLNALSIRGEEIVRATSPMKQEKLKLAIYGESKVYFNELTVKDLTVSIYGESYLEIESGSVDSQVYRAYGESEVNTSEMKNKNTKIIAYGESNFRVNVSDRLKVTCYGETTVTYEGNAELDKGIVIGEAEIRRIG
jgi:hypothetical protein